MRNLKGLTKTRWMWLHAATVAIWLGSMASPQQLVEVVGKSEKVEVEVVTLTPDGFFPNRLTLPARPFVLLLENRTGNGEDIDVRLEAPDSRLLKATAMKKHEVNFGETLRLPAGTYKLRVQGKGQFELTLEVKP